MTKKITKKQQQPKEAKAVDKKINVAIIGVGNCASSFVQGVHYYANATEDDFVPGLMHVDLGGYHISDINFVAAIDIDKNKVGKDLSEAIFRYADGHKNRYVTHLICPGAF